MARKVGSSTQFVHQMNHTPHEILHKCQYYIKYNFNSYTHTATININTTEQHEIVVKWLPDEGLIETNWVQEFIHTPEYAVPGIVLKILHEICEKFGFPFRLISFYLNDQPTNVFYFILENADVDPRILNFTNLSDQIERLGIQTDIIETVINEDMVDGFSAYCQYAMGIQISGISCRKKY